MTKEEIIKIAKLMLIADGWCTSCNHALLENLQVLYPEYDIEIREVEASQDDIQKRYKEEYSKFYVTGEGVEPRVWEF